MRVKLLLWIVIFAGVAMAGFAAWYRRELGIPHGREVQATSPDSSMSNVSAIRTVAALGRLEPEGEILELGTSTNQRLARLLVSEGQLVEQGQELAYLETHDERLAEKQQVSAQLAEARKLLDAETAFGEAAIRAAEIKVAQTEQLYPLRIDSQQARIRANEAELATNRNELKRKQRLLDRSITEEEIERQRLLVGQSEESLTIAKTTLETLRSEFQLNLDLARAELQRARASLARAQALIAVDSLEKRLALLDARIELTIIRAPADGQILEILTRPGEQIGPEPILQMGNTSVMHAVAEVYETDVQWVRLGQQATIRSPALRDRLSGKVVQIGVQIYKNDILDVDPAADADARVVEVRIELEGSNQASGLTNLQVDVEIMITGADTVDTGG